MSKANPQIGIDAILATPKKVAEFTVNPLKLGMLAILEKIESPICTGEPLTLFSMLPTTFAMTHPYRDTLVALYNNRFPEMVMQWADTMDDRQDILLELQDACIDEITRSLETGQREGNSGKDPLTPSDEPTVGS